MNKYLRRPSNSVCLIKMYTIKEVHQFYKDFVFEK